MSYAYGDRVVWVTDLEPTAHPMTHDLCAEHATNISAPLGWEVRDQRLRRAGTLFEAQPFETEAFESASPRHQVA